MYACAIQTSQNGIRKFAPVKYSARAKRYKYMDLSNSKRPVWVSICKSEDRRFWRFSCPELVSFTVKSHWRYSQDMANWTLLWMSCPGCAFWYTLAHNRILNKGVFSVSFSCNSLNFSLQCFHSLTSSNRHCHCPFWCMDYPAPSRPGAPLENSREPAQKHEMTGINSQPGFTGSSQHFLQPGAN